MFTTTTYNVLFFYKWLPSQQSQDIPQYLQVSHLHHSEDIQAIFTISETAFWWLNLLAGKDKPTGMAQGSKKPFKKKTFSFSSSTGK